MVLGSPMPDEARARLSTQQEPPLLPRGRLPARHRDLRGRGRSWTGLVQLSAALALLERR